MAQWGGVTTCEFNVENKYYACVGAEFNIYYENISLVKNLANIYYVAKKTSGNATIESFNDCIRITPNSGSLGDVIVNVKAYRKDSGSLISEVNLNITVIDAPSFNRPIKIMFLGDSLTNGGWQNTLKELMPNNIVLYGTLGGGTALHEGRVSWSAHNYCNSASYNGLTNPFYNNGLTTSSKFDFSYYMTNNSSFADVDYVNVFLGRNFSYGLEEVDKIKLIIDSIRSYSANIIITVTMGYILGYQPYQNLDYEKTYTQRKIIFDFNNYLHTKIGNMEKVYFVPQFINIDNVYDHPNSIVEASGRNTSNNRGTIVNDTIHFSSVGYKKLADSYYPVFAYLNNLYPKAAIVSDVDKTTLDANIVSANTNLGSVTISVDGTDVASNLTWVTQSAYDTYSAAIVSASSVSNSSTATQEEVNTSVSSLGSATTTFNNAKSSGTNSSIVFTLPEYSQTDYPTYLILQDLSYTIGGTTPKYWLYASHCPNMSCITYGEYNGYFKIDFEDSSTANGTTNFIKYKSNDGNSWTQDGGVYQYSDYVTTSIQQLNTVVAQTKDGTRQSVTLDYSDINLWESGDYNYTTGLKIDSASRIRLKDMIDVSNYSSIVFNLNNSSYTPLLRTYSSDGTFVSASTSSTFKATSGVGKIALAMYNSSNSGLTFTDYQTAFTEGTIKPIFIVY